MTSTDGSKCRVIVQQCMSAKLQTQVEMENQSAEFVEVGRGIVVYICFLNDADGDAVKKLAKTVMELKLSEDDGGKYVSVIDLPGDVLIVPQATLGGKCKGKMMQYHRNIDKNVGKELYQLFKTECDKWLATNCNATDLGNKVKCGTYGNRQVLSIVTNGPYSHIIEV